MKLDKNGKIIEPKVEPKLPYFTPPQPTQGTEYGINVPQLKPWIQVEESWDWTGWSSVKTLVFEKLASGGTWNVDYTWFWFNPTSYTIDAWWKNSTGQLTTFSKSFVDSSWTESGYRTYTTSAYYLNNLSDAIYVWSSSTWRTRADHDEFIEDWIRLDYALSDLDIKMIITAYA